ncbi:MAG: hypothetical protein AB8H79_10790 [Myxococcota bacterium]
MSEEETEAETPTVEEAESAPKGRDQVPTHLPPQLRELFTKHEGSIAARPGFRNPSNKNAKAQKKRKKKK